MPTPHLASADILRFARLLWQPSEVREFRAPRYNEYLQTASGYFDSPESFARAACGWDGRANVYVTLNPVDPSLLARASNRIELRAQHTTSDQDVIRRRFLFIDTDPVRPAGISSSEGEREAALAVLEETTLFLSQQGWPEPITALSGNGYYALYEVDLPNDETSQVLVKRVLESLARRFDSPRARIDPSVYNASRICCIVGTLKMKGDSSEERPHRRSVLLSVPPVLSPVNESLLRQVAGDTESTVRPLVTSGPTNNARPLSELLDHAGISYKEQPPDAAGFTWYHVHRCPFHEDGKDYECGVGQKLPDGPYAGHCFHPEGTGKGWQEFKFALGLGTRSRPVPDHESSSLSFGERTAGGQRLPEIVVTNKHLHVLSEAAWSALVEANDPPWLFQHGGALAQIERDEAGRNSIKDLSLPAIRGLLDRAAVWLRASKDELVPARPPRDVI